MKSGCQEYIDGLSKLKKEYAEAYAAGCHLVISGLDEFTQQDIRFQIDKRRGNSLYTGFPEEGPHE